MMDRRSALSLLLLMGLVPTGCAALPTSGAVVSEPRRDQVAGPGGAAIDPDPPTPGASPALIIDGFLHAMATFQPGYPLARQYLTTSANKTWKPDEGVFVYADGTEPTATDDKVTMEVPLIGTLGSDGAFSTEEAGIWSHDFEVVKENGEWRIGNPQTGILVSLYLFTSGFVRHDVFFLDTTRATLVPDARYVARGNRTPSRVLQLLLSGPSQWLRSAVVTAVPAATTIVGSVGESGDISIPFSEAPANATDRSLMCVQIAGVLRQLPEVTGFRFTAKGAAVDITEQRADGSIPLSMADRYDPLATLANQLFAMSDGHLVRVPESFGGAVRSVDGDFGTLTWEARALAVGVDGVNAALLVGDQIIQGTVDGQGTRPVFVRQDLLRPQFSRDGALWTMTKAGELWRIDGDHVVQVQAPGLKGRTVVAFRLSPDGQRIALVTVRNGIEELGLLRIEHGTNLVADGWRSVPLRQGSTVLSGALDVGWNAPTSITVLAGTGSSAIVIEVDIDGVMLQDDGRADAWSATSLAVSAKGARKSVGDSADSIWKYQDSYRWIRFTGKLSAPSYPG